jgi:heterodisulfide reductase subunit C
MSSPNFKKWDKCKNILEMIYETGINVEEQISSTNEIIELVAFNELNISKTEIENAFKIFGHLNIYQRIGNKRILKMEEEDAFVALKKHFKIK